MDITNAFLHGILVALSFVIAGFFIRYWRVSRDRFFIFIALCFIALGLNWAAQEAFVTTEHAVWVFSLRLLAFLILIIGIVDKNRRGKSSK